MQTYGYLGANSAHSNFVDAPSAPRDGKTVGLAPADCRRLLDAPDITTPIGVRYRALLAVLAYSAYRVGELVKLRHVDFKAHSGHRVLEVQGKGGKERRVALHPEAVERLKLGLDPAFTVHSLRVTALTTARERGSDLIALQDFAGHADPRTTLTYLRNRDRLAKSPASVLTY